MRAALLLLVLAACSADPKEPPTCGGLLECPGGCCPAVQDNPTWVCGNVWSLCPAGVCCYKGDVLPGDGVVAIREKLVMVDLK